MRGPGGAGRAWIPAALGAGAGALYASFLVDLAKRDSAGVHHIVSGLAAPGEPHATLYRVGDVGCAALVVALLPRVRAALPAGPAREVAVGATAVFAGGAAVAGVVPTPHGPGSAVPAVDQVPSVVHDRASLVSDAALYLGTAAAWMSTRRHGPRWFHRAAWWLFWLGGVGSGLVFARVEHTGRPRWAAGVTQRVHILGISAWLCCLGLLAAGAARRPPDTRKGRPG